MKKEIRQIVHEKYNGHCAYCGVEISISEMQIDHIHPKYKGGKDEIENFNPSCRMCNFYKGTQAIEAFRYSLQHTLFNSISAPFQFRLGERYGMVQKTAWNGKFYFETIT